MKAWRGVIEEYRDFLPVTDKTPIVTLHEGNTPLIPAPRLAEATDTRMQIYLKYEGLNPTGSFKDRGHDRGDLEGASRRARRAVICASTGNTSRLGRRVRRARRHHAPRPDAEGQRSRSASSRRP